MQTDVCFLIVNPTWKGFCCGGLSADAVGTSSHCKVQRSDVIKTKRTSVGFVFLVFVHFKEHIERMAEVLMVNYSLKGIFHPKMKMNHLFTFMSF